MAQPYPKSIIAHDCLYVIYATNKEDIQVTRVPLTSLSPPMPPKYQAPQASGP